MSKKQEVKNSTKCNLFIHVLAPCSLLLALLKVCDVCGAFVNFWVGSSGENQNRVDDHLMGKLHLGYARLKVTVD